jgi:hypothetical protein
MARRAAAWMELGGASGSGASRLACRGTEAPRKCGLASDRPPSLVRSGFRRADTKADGRAAGPAVFHVEPAEIRDPGPRSRESGDGCARNGDHLGGGEGFAGGRTGAGGESRGRLASQPS